MRPSPQPAGVRFNEKRLAACACDIALEHLERIAGAIVAAVLRYGEQLRERPAYLVGQGSLRFGLQPRRGVCTAQRPDAGRRMENGRRSNITASSTSPSMTNALCVGTVPPVSTT